MILIAAILLLIALIIGIRLSVHHNGKVLPFSAALIAAASFIGIIWWSSPPVSQSFRRDMAHLDFVKISQPIDKPDAYSLILARGEISSVREKWSFANLGRLVAYTTETTPVEVEPKKFEIKESRKYFKGVSGTFSLPGLPAKLNIGWDDRGSEFINVMPYRASKLYVRPFTSYYGVFPSKSESFAATRLLISGSIENSSGSIFGLARGKMAFLIVQPEAPGPKVSLNAETLFHELSFTQNPYTNSNNLASFDDARKLLLRGMIFPRHANGVLAVLGSISPVIGAMLSLLAICVFILWIRWLFPAMFLAVLLAMLTVIGTSTLERDSTIESSQRGGDSGLYSMAALFSSPLWDETTRITLEKLASASNPDSRKWATFLLSVRFPSTAGSNRYGGDETTEETDPLDLDGETGANTEYEGNGFEPDVENLPLP